MRCRRWWRNRNTYAIVTKCLLIRKEGNKVGKSYFSGEKKDDERVGGKRFREHAGLSLECVMLRRSSQRASEREEVRPGAHFFFLAWLRAGGTAVTRPHSVYSMGQRGLSSCSALPCPATPGAFLPIQQEKKSRVRAELQGLAPATTRLTSETALMPLPVHHDIPTPLAQSRAHPSSSPAREYHPGSSGPNQAVACTAQPSAL